MKCGASRVWLDPSRLGDISQAITSGDIRRLVNDGVIKKHPPKAGINRAKRAYLVKQKKAGRRKGKGSRKGGAGSRTSRKSSWIARVRAQRKLLKELLQAERIDRRLYRSLYRKSGGGFFRSRAHIMSYIEEHAEVPAVAETKPVTEAETKE